MLEKIEELPPEEIVQALEEIPEEVVGVVVQNLETTKAAQVIAEAPRQQVVKIVETGDPEQLARVIEQAPTEKVAEALAEASTEKAAGVVANVRTEKAAQLVSSLLKVRAERAVDIVEELPTGKATEVLSGIPPEGAGEVMTKMKTEKVVEVIQAMAEDDLIERVQEVDPEKVREVPVEVLVQKIRSVDVEVVVVDKPPEAVGPPPEKRVEDGREIYVVRDVRGREWRILVGTPAPLEAVLGRFARPMGQFEVVVEDLPGKPDDLPDLPAGLILNAFFQINTTGVRPEDVDAVHATMFVDKEWLKANQIPKWAVQLFRFDQELGEWVPFPAKRQKETEDRIFYSVVLPGFSVFAVAGSKEPPKPVFEVTNLVMDPPEAAPGQPVAIRAEVTNISLERRVYPGQVYVDGVIEDTAKVILESGETRDVTFTVILDQEGTHQVRVGRQLADLKITPLVLPPGRGVGFWLGIAIGALVALGLVALLLATYLSRRARGLPPTPAAPAPEPARPSPRPEPGGAGSPSG